MGNGILKLALSHYPAAKEAMQQENFKINKIVFETKGLLKKPLV